MGLAEKFKAWLSQPVNGAKPAPTEQPTVVGEAAPAVQPSHAPDFIDFRRMKEQMVLHEGNRSRIYTDTVGKVSGGIGRNLTDVGFRPDEINLMFLNDLREAMTGLDVSLPWWRSLDPIRARVLLDMSFNMGMPRLLGFNNTLNAIKQGRWDDASAGMLASKWAGQVGERAERLARMMRTGQDYPS